MVRLEQWAMFWMRNQMLEDEQKTTLTHSWMLTSKRDKSIRFIIYRFAQSSGNMQKTYLLVETNCPCHLHKIYQKYQFKNKKQALLGVRPRTKLKKGT